MQKKQMRHASWQELLGPPSPAAHFVQIYDSDAFLAAGVAYFAAEGLRRGEMVLLTGTQPHLRDIRRQIAGHGVEPEAAIRGGQLALRDAHEALRVIVDDGKVDAPRFQAAVDDVFSAASREGRFSGVRWWGEISNVLQQQGDTQAALDAEDEADAAAKKHGITLFCSYLYDRFDPLAYDGTLRHVCCKHSHAIPAEDYVRHRIAVNQAIREVIGEIRGPLLQSLMSWEGLPCELPTSQALLFWIRETLPECFAEVLSRAKLYQAQPPALAA
jgi:hypothetical protein